MPPFLPAYDGHANPALADLCPTDTVRCKNSKDGERTGQRDGVDIVMGPGGRKRLQRPHGQTLAGPPITLAMMTQTDTSESRVSADKRPDAGNCVVSAPSAETLCTVDALSDPFPATLMYKRQV